MEIGLHNYRHNSAERKSLFDHKVVEVKRNKFYKHKCSSTPGIPRYGSFFRLPRTKPTQFLVLLKIILVQVPP